MKDKMFPADLSEIKKSVVQSLKDKNNAGRIPNWTHEYGGAESGATWRRNLDSYKSIGFKMKAISDLNPEKIDLSAALCGREFELPIGAAPMSAAISFTCENAFEEMAKGCQQLSIPAGIGNPTGQNVHKRMLDTGAAVFRLIKPLKDTDKLRDEIMECEADGCFATGIDTDSAAGLKPAGDSGHFADIAKTLSIEEIKAVRKSVGIPFIIKGVLSVEDALAASEAGADAIVVSTHAGYAMDYCKAPLEVLPDIKKAVSGDMSIIVDSGITRGSDIIKALALGAEYVLVGRLMIWGLLLGGANGVAWVINMLREEMIRVMTLLGVERIGDLNTDCLVALNDMGDRILK